ncbi:MAG: deoxyguanosinetriphosphate triphosphohydrolase [Thermomicrobiales bacterium]
MTSLRERWEDQEDRLLAPMATRSRGAVRLHPEEVLPTRSEFQRDRDRIIHSKSFRRLMHKTQVFIAPRGDHYRTRLTHTLEVTQIARTIGRALQLNEDLIEAIGMGHDLGHTPFGHAGESALAEMYPGFRHNEQSLRVVEHLERDGRGLNLTEPVRDGILRHSKPRESLAGNVSGIPATPEGNVVKISDSIAYMNHDLDDAINAGIIAPADIPDVVIYRLGNSHASRINTLVEDVIGNSSVDSASGSVIMSSELRLVADELRGFLFEKVYDPLNRLTETINAQRIVRSLYTWYLDHPERLPDPDAASSPDRLVADHIASMTDRFAIDLAERLFDPLILVP